MQTERSAARPVGTGDGGLRAPGNTVDPRAVGYWRWSLLLSTAAPVAVLLVLAVLLPTGATPWLVAPAAALAVVGGAATATLPDWWFRVHRWEVTDTAVHTRAGWFWRESRIAPLSRVQTVDTTRNPLEQRFGLATLVVTTASAKGAVTVEGLDHETAEELAHRLGEVAETVHGDAT